MVNLRDTFPVMLTFDVDGESLWLNRDPQNAERPVALSQGRYGPLTGVPKITRLLARYGIQATFFVPGWIAEQYPDMVKALVAEGHEVGHHGYRHEWLTRIEPAQEEPILIKGLEALEKTAGVQALGYRAPAWELTPRTLGLLERHGFVYSSNMMDTDAPYRHRIDGRPSRLVELPVAWTLDDSSMYLYSLQIPGSKLMANEEVLSMWCGEFDGLYADGGSCVLTCHPQLTGRSYRLAALERFVQHARRQPRVAFVRCIDAAEHFQAAL